MALTRDDKAAQLSDLKTKLEKSKSVMFAHYIGMTVTDVSELREKLRAKNAEMKVGKKTLIRMAMKDVKMPEVDESVLDGPVACIFSYEDPIAGAQVAHAFAKTHEQVHLISGVFDGKVLTKREANEFAMMPSRDALLATFASMIRSPLVKFAMIVNSPLTGFARGLNQLSEKGGIPGKTPAAPPVAEAPAAPIEAPAPVAEAPAAPEASASPETPAPESAPQ